MDDQGVMGGGGGGRCPKLSINSLDHSIKKKLRDCYTRDIAAERYDRAFEGIPSTANLHIKTVGQQFAI